MSQTSNEERLYKLFTNVNDWLKFGEAKNLGLLTFNAAALFGLSQTDFGSNDVLLFALIYVFTPFTIVSTVFALLSLMPILSAIESNKKWTSIISKISSGISKEKTFVNIHFYGHLRNVDVAAFTTEYNTKTGNTTQLSGFENDLITQIIYNSKITWLKFQLFKIGTAILFSGILVSIIAYILGLLFHGSADSNCC